MRLNEVIILMKSQKDNKSIDQLIHLPINQ